jgi:hypothetical protein
MPRQSKAELFIQTFLFDGALASQHLGLILRTLEEQYLGIDGVRAALSRLLELGLNLHELAKLELKGTRTE